MVLKRNSLFEVPASFTFSTSFRLPSFDQTQSRLLCPAPPPPFEEIIRWWNWQFWPYPNLSKTLDLTVFSFRFWISLQIVYVLWSLFECHIFKYSTIYGNVFLPVFISSFLPSPSLLFWAPRHLTALLALAHNPDWLEGCSCFLGSTNLDEV